MDRKQEQDLFIFMGEIKTSVKNIDEHLKTLNGSVKSQGDEINNLKSYRDITTGKIAIIGTVFGFVGSIILLIIGWFIRK